LFYVFIIFKKQGAKQHTTDTSVFVAKLVITVRLQ